jgi:transcription elongation factor Elf1
MSLRLPHHSIKQHARVPAICTHCGLSTEFTERSETVDSALIDSTCLEEACAELALLARAAELFARFPESKHALKVGREQLNPKQFPRTTHDREFEAALATDPELSDFLRHAIFYLPARRRDVRERIEQMSQTDFSVIPCPHCGNVLRLPQEFYHAL